MQCLEDKKMLAKLIILTVKIIHIANYWTHPLRLSESGNVLYQIIPKMRVVWNSNRNMIMFDFI